MRLATYLYLMQSLRVSETVLSVLHNYTLIWATMHFVVTGHVFFSTPKFPIGQSFFFNLSTRANFWLFVFFSTQFAFFSVVPKYKEYHFFSPLMAFKQKKFLYLMVETQRYRRKVEGSIPEGIIGILYSHNPSGRTMGLGSN